MTKTPSVTRKNTLRHRVDVTFRVAAASVGGYAMASFLAIAAARALPMARIEAATTATMLALLAVPVAAMGCFWAASAWRAWAGILLFSSLFATIALIAGWRP